MLTAVRRPATLPPTKHESCRRGAHVQTLDTITTKFLERKEKTEQRGPRTIEAYRTHCRYFRDFVAVQHGRVLAKHFTRATIEAWVANLFDRGIARVTVINRLATLRELAKFGVRERYWSADPFADFQAPRLPRSLPKALKADARDALLGLALTLQDTALRAILYYGGLRTIEVTRLRLRDLVPSADGTRGALKVHGKGDKERMVPLNAHAWEAIERYVLDKAPEDRKPADFLFSHRGGEAWHTRMIRRRVIEWRVAAGVPEATAHRFRHTFVTNLLQAGKRIEVVRDMVGHASVATTQLYARVVNADLEDAADALPVLGQDSGSAQKARVESTGGVRNAAK